MARRRKRLLKLGPAALAHDVRVNFVAKIQRDLPQMRDNYLTGMEGFITDPQRRFDAIVRLAALYLGMRETNYPARMKEAYTEARNDYYMRLRRVSAELQRLLGVRPVV